MEYARQYLSLDREGYRNTWYKFHIYPDANAWPTVLLLCELGFSLPLSNGYVKRIFSLKLIKTDRRTTLQTSALSDLLEIKVQGPSLQDFSPKQAVDMWWTDCKTTRRINQGPQKEYQSRQAAGSLSSFDVLTSTTEEPRALEEWDMWFRSPDFDN